MELRPVHVEVRAAPGDLLDPALDPGARRAIQRPADDDDLALDDRLRTEFHRAAHGHHVARHAPIHLDRAENGDDVAVDHFVRPHVDAGPHPDAVIRRIDRHHPARLVLFVSHGGRIAGRHPGRVTGRHPRRVGWHRGPPDPEQDPAVVGSEIRQADDRVRVLGHHRPQLGAGHGLAVDRDPVVGDGEVLDLDVAVLREQQNPAGDLLHLVPVLDLGPQSGQRGGLGLGQRVGLREGPSRAAGRHQGQPRGHGKGASKRTQ